MRIRNCPPEVVEEIERAAELLNMRDVDFYVTCSEEEYARLRASAVHVPESLRDVVYHMVREEVARSHEITTPLPGGEFAVYVRPGAPTCDIIHALGHALLFTRYRYMLYARARSYVLSSSLDMAEHITLALAMTAHVLENAIEDMIVDTLLLYYLRGRYCYEECIRSDLHKYEKLCSDIMEKISNSEDSEPGITLLPTYLRRIEYVATELQRDYYRALLGLTTSLLFDNLRREILSVRSAEDLHRVVSRVTEYYQERMWAELGPTILPPMLHLCRDEMLSQVFKAWVDVLELDTTHLVVWTP
jgi:hypothetical protein